MRVTIFAIMLAVLSACGGGRPAELPTDRVSARFPAGGVVNVIEVDAVTRLPLRAAELIVPGGQPTPAGSITAEPAPTETFYPPLGNGTYGGGNFGVADIGGNALTPGVIGTTPQARTRLLATISTASITLPDPVAYRRDWQKYRIQLRFGDPSGDVETREIPAPAPPSNG